MSLAWKAVLVAALACLTGLSPADAAPLASSAPDPAVDGRPYGVSALPDPTPREAASDAAAGAVNRLRREWFTTGALAEASRSEALDLRYSASPFLSDRDLTFLASVTSARMGAFSAEGLGQGRVFGGIAAEIKAASPNSPADLALAAREDFASWLAALRSEAFSQGVPGRVMDEALTGLTTMQSVLDLENSQPEHTITFEQYLDRVVSAGRIQRGREQMARFKPALEAVSAAYGVGPTAIAALWGIETNYGANMGDFPIVRALATLAYAGKRPSFYRKELIEALLILAEEGMPSRDLKGSWAGAMGQCQFMPSSFRRLAMDGDGDGKRDIWKTEKDVFASAANYLSKAGWRPTERWGQAVAVPNGFEQALADLKVVKPVSEWERLGVAPSPGASLPAGGVQASVVRPSGPGGRAFIVMQNFRVFMSWNRSTYFATAAGLLSDRLGEPPAG